MNLIRRTLEIDAGTDARLDAIAAERGQDVSTVLAEALALFDSVVDITEADLGEDRRRLGEFMRTREAIPLDEVKTWVASWDSSSHFPKDWMIVLSPDAIADIDRMRCFLNNKNSGAAQRAMALILSAIERLHDFPDRGLPTGDGIRQIVIKFGASGYAATPSFPRRRTF